MSNGFSQCRQHNLALVEAEERDFEEGLDNATRLLLSYRPAPVPLWTVRNGV